MFSPVWWRSLPPQWFSKSSLDGARVCLQASPIVLPWIKKNRSCKALDRKVCQASDLKCRSIEPLNCNAYWFWLIIFIFPSRRKYWKSPFFVLNHADRNANTLCSGHGSHAAFNTPKELHYIPSNVPEEKIRAKRCFEMIKWQPILSISKKIHRNIFF